MRVLLGSFVLLLTASIALGEVSLNQAAPRPTQIFKDGESFPGCGLVPESLRRRRDISEFIVGGGNANQNQHPWHAALVNTSGIFCGANLISTTALLTSAHCVVEKSGRVKLPSDFEVILGIHNRNELMSTIVGDRQELKVEGVFPHPEFSRKSHWINNLAVVTLKGNGALITPSVRPICLWKDDINFRRIENKKGKVVGWGLTENRELSKTLQVAKMRIFPREECLQVQRQQNETAEFQLPERKFCAGSNGANACKGDGGGGFAIAQGRRWYLRGLASDGVMDIKVVDGVDKIGCPTDVPSIYTDVAYYLDWIVQVTSSLNVN